MGTSQMAQFQVIEIILGTSQHPNDVIFVC